ncbi:MAG: hypothetical protein VYA86_05790 [Candidatus Thermoplasmatota archaeon]|nr:hypothetical protein [Candidatus Thermoplasmatota archaeon]
MRHLAPLLVLLFVFTAFSGCIGGSDASWGTSDGEYSVTIGDSDNVGSSAKDMSVTNKLAPSSSNHVIGDEEIIGCENSTYSISGWLAQTKIFDQPQVTTSAVASWMILEKPYTESQDIKPGSVFVQIVSKEDDWPSPNQAEGIPMVDGVLANGKASEFPHNGWALLAIIPANQNVFEAVIQMDSNQAISLNGYILQDEYYDENQIQNCALEASSKGLARHFVVTSITYGNERVVSSSQAYVAGDIPLIGRGLYTTTLLISIVASGALYLYSRNQLILSADSQAQTMLSEQQMRAGKAARHEAARHEARMEAVAKAKVEDFSGKPKKKSSGVAKFDINAALAEQGPGVSTAHYVAGSSVTATDEAEAMEDMIADMQKEHEFEQELQEKGLRNIIEGLPRGGRRSTGGSSRPRSSTAEPKEQLKPKSRKTRKTKSQEESVDEVEVPERLVDSDVNDDGDFSDFSL